MASRRAAGSVEYVVAGDGQAAAVCVDKVAKIGRRREDVDGVGGGGDGVAVAVDRVEEIGGNGVDIWAQIFIDQTRRKMNSQLNK
uniref:Uncharacterized protein n=1 Tax=Oryza meridionalis TaxID=40149 RepID=A0A0E0DLT2_9ORYZ